MCRTSIPIQPLTASEAASFTSKVLRLASCWLWVGAKTPEGYGAFSMRKRSFAAHRVAYTLYVGEIKAGLQIDHLCRRKDCVNPEHLEPVTPRENQLRRDGYSLSAR